MYVTVARKKKGWSKASTCDRYTCLLLEGGLQGTGDDHVAIMYYEGYNARKMLFQGDALSGCSSRERVSR